MNRCLVAGRIGALILSALVSAPVGAWAQDDADSAAAAAKKETYRAFFERIRKSKVERGTPLRPEFIEAVRLARLPKSEQAKSIQRIVELYEAAVRNPSGQDYIIGIIGFTSNIGGFLNYRDFSEDVLADALIEANGAISLLAAQRQFLRPVLLANLNALKPILKSHLQSTDEKRLATAMLILATLGHHRTGPERAAPSAPDQWLSEFYEDVAAVYDRGGASAESAARALLYIDDPRGIGLLTESSANIKRYQDILYGLSSARPAHPKLMELLRDDDEQTRAGAASILSNSGDAQLVSYVAGLLGDHAPQIRRNAIHMGFSLQGESFVEIRSFLTQALRDAVVEVRIAAARGFARRKDKIAAQTLYDLAKDSAFEVDDAYGPNRTAKHRLYFSFAGDITQAIADLTGQNFGFHTDNNSWFPNSKWNLEARRQFFEWMKINTSTNISATMRVYLLNNVYFPQPDPIHQNWVRKNLGYYNSFESPREAIRTSQIVINAYDLKSARAGLTEENQPAVFFELRPEGARRLAAVTKKFAGQDRHLVVFVDGNYVLSFPVQAAWTSGKGRLDGVFKDRDQARIMAARLNAGRVTTTSH